METSTRPAKDTHDAIHFQSAEWGALTMEERGKAMRCTSEAAVTGAPAARRLRRKARHRLNQGARPYDIGPVVLVWPEESARGEVWVSEGSAIASRGR